MVNYFFISETLTFYLSNYQSRRRIYSIIEKKKKKRIEKRIKFERINIVKEGKAKCTRITKWNTWIDNQESAN